MGPLVVLMLGGLLLLPVCGTAPAPHDRYNLLFIIVDNMRPALGCYNNTEVVTPRMDALAERSTLFSRAFCQEAWCSPSRNSFLTGRTPDQTKTWNFQDSFRKAATGGPGAVSSSYSGAASPASLARGRPARRRPLCESPEELPLFADCWRLTMCAGVLVDHAAGLLQGRWLLYLVFRQGLSQGPPCELRVRYMRNLTTATLL